MVEHMNRIQEVRDQLLIFKENMSTLHSEFVTSMCQSMFCSQQILHLMHENTVSLIALKKKTVPDKP